MRKIPIKAIPNQSFYVNLGAIYKLAFHWTGRLLTATITRNNEIIIQGINVVPFMPIIPYKYLENGNGNFLFTTKNNDEVHFSQFNLTQSLYYLDDAEMTKLKRNIGDIVKESDFDSRSELPLRFKPVGYTLA